jgi:hypothetical protein
MLVPKKGLEPPHPCEYMDLNHARLPIPPLRLEALGRLDLRQAIGNGGERNGQRAAQVLSLLVDLPVKPARDPALRRPNMGRKIRGAAGVSYASKSLKAAKLAIASQLSLFPDNPACGTTKT